MSGCIFGSEAVPEPEPEPEGEVRFWVTGPDGQNIDLPPLPLNLTSPSGSGSGSGTASLPKMQPDIEAPIMTSTSIHAWVRMSGRFLRLQIILPQEVSNQSDPCSRHGNSSRRRLLLVCGRCYAWPSGS